MSKLSHASSRRMYSWWWDSHISPQNSRWLVENLTDMDAKVKSMIKLIEQDADSFASRAEMYYEKRPELLKLVEEFYRAYRALAERYDHATGALRQATEAFPNQVPSEITEEELEICANQNDKDNFGEQRVERGLDINGAEDNEQNTLSSVKLEKKIQTLSEVLAKFEAEKESSLAQYKHCLDKLTHQEIDFFNAQEGSKGLAERANKAEDEVGCLRKSLKALEFEKEKSLLECQKYLENIKNMEEIISSAQKDIFDLNERAHKAETEAQTLKINLAAVELEKATSLGQCKQSIEKILDLENKLIISENEAKELNKRAEESKTEAETLKQQCLDSVSSLETKLTCSQEEVQMLNEEVEKGIYKLKGAEEQYLDLKRSNQYLQTELQTLKLEIGAQSEELMEKKRELTLLSTRVEEEKLRFVEAETAFQMSQLLQAQTEKELNSLSLELEKRSLNVIDLETRNRSLVNEALKITEENKSLNELNLAYSLSMKDMQSEILRLKEAKEKLEEEFELGVDQKNTLQQEIYSVKEEFNDLSKNYHNMVDQVDAVGFKPECFQSAVKDLQDENLNLKETRERESREKEDLLKKLENLENVNEKNALLEKLVSDLNADLEGARDEIVAMVKSIRSLFEEKNILDSEKASLVTQLQVANENLEKLSEKNTSIEMTVSDANDAIEGLKMKLKGIENEKSDLINEKVTLVSQVEITGERLEGIEKKLRELEEKHLVLKKEKESTICEAEELRLINKEYKLNEDKHMIEIENLHGMVLDTQKTSVALRKDNLKLIDEKISLVKDLLDLQDKNSTIEGENLSILGETASLSNLSLILKNIVNEKALEIESLEEKTNSKDKIIELLKEKISGLEVKNGEIEDQLAGYLPAISSLKECITSLEICTSLQRPTCDNEKVKAAMESHVEGHEGSIVDQKEADKLSELKELEERVKNVEKKVIETNSKLENATRQVEENTKPLSVNSELLNGLLTKDIMLDQISNMNGEGKVTTPTKKSVHFNSIIEKELGEDKIAAANKFSLPNEELDKTMILERVNSDSQKLTNLQIIVQDLKRKAETSEKMREGKSIDEYKSVKKLLEKAEKDIKELSDLNGNMTKSVDKPDDVKYLVESEERRKFSEQAREASERIGQLEFDVQKIEYIMLKLGSESGKENIKKKSETTESKRTSFRNYLGLKTSSKTKKRAFCGFVEPPTIEN